MVEIKGLYKSFGKLEVLKGVDLHLKGGKISAVLGPNASGKTTIIKSILGLVIPDKGEIIINGQNIKGKWDYRQEIGYMPQIARFPDNLSVTELISMVQDLRGTNGNGHHDLIDTFQLEPYLEKSLRNLSGGTRQKVNAVIALMFDTPMLIFDEPTTGLDPVSLIRMKDLIDQEKEKGRTILLTTHIMPLVEELADEIIFLLEGKIYFQGTIEELRSKYNEQNLERAIAKLIGGNGHE